MMSQLHPHISIQHPAYLTESNALDKSVLVYISKALRSGTAFEEVARSIVTQRRSAREQKKLLDLVGEVYRKQVPNCAV